MRDFVECTVLLLFHVFLHIPQKQRTNVGKVTNMMTYRSTNVTGEVAKPRVGNAMAAMNVDMDTTCPPPPPPPLPEPSAEISLPVCSLLSC